MKLLTHGLVDEVSAMAAVYLTGGIALRKCVDVMWGRSVTTLFQKGAELLACFDKVSLVVFQRCRYRRKQASHD